MVAATKNGTDWGFVMENPDPSLAYSYNDALHYRYDERTTDKTLVPVTNTERLLGPSYTLTPDFTWDFHKYHDGVWITARIDFHELFLRVGKNWIQVLVDFKLRSQPVPFLNIEEWTVTVDLSGFLTDITASDPADPADSSVGAYVQQFIGKVIPNLPRAVLEIKVKTNLDPQAINPDSALLAALVVLVSYRAVKLTRHRLQGQPPSSENPNLGEPGALL